MWRLLLPSLFPISLEYAAIGWVIPGLIANHCERQGVVVTSSALITIVVLLYVLGRMLGLD
jgi:phosphate starvation-inducible membrane PsiE